MEKKYKLHAILNGQCYADEDMEIKITCEKCLSFQCILHPLYEEKHEVLEEVI